MSLNRGVIPAERDDELYIGWAKAPAVDRRFLFGAAPLLLGATTALGWLIAKTLPTPAPANGKRARHRSSKARSSPGLIR